MNNPATGIQATWQQVIWHILSIIMLLALPFILWLPDLRNDLASVQMAKHLQAAIYRFPSDALPKCDQFIRYTAMKKFMRVKVVCQTRMSDMIV